MNQPLKLGGILFIITAVCVGILGAVNAMTTPIIERNEQALEERTMEALMAGADAFEVAEIVPEDMIKKVTIALKENECVGYIIRIEPQGYGGTIKLLVGIDTDGKVTGIDILEHAETPGFGANADKEGFKNQYMNKLPELTVSKNDSNKEDEIVAITGATITSNAITKGVNSAWEFINNHKAEWGD